MTTIRTFSQLMEYAAGCVVEENPDLSTEQLEEGEILFDAAACLLRFLTQAGVSQQQVDAAKNLLSTMMYNYVVHDSPYVWLGLCNVSQQLHAHYFDALEVMNMYGVLSDLLIDPDPECPLDTKVSFRFKPHALVRLTGRPPIRKKPCDADLVEQHAAAA